MSGRRRVSPRSSGSSGLAVGSGMRAIALVGQFATSVIVSRALGVEEYGQFALAFAITGILALLLGMELSNQVARSGPAAGPRYWGTALLLGIAAGVALVAAALTLAPSGAVRGAMLALVPSALSGPAFSTLVGAAMVQQRAGLAAGLGNAVFIVKLPVASLVVLVFSDPGPVHFAAIDSLISLAVLSVAVRALRAWSWPLRPTSAALRDVIRGARSLLPAALGAALVARLDVVMLGFLRGPEDVGAYQVAVRIGEMPLDLYAGALIIFLPTVSTIADGADLDNYYRRVTESLGRSLLPLVAGFVVYGDVAIGLVFGEQFALHPFVYVVIGLGIFSHIASGPNGAVLVGRNRGRALVLLALWLIGGDVMFNLLLIPLWGVVGAALATTICFLVVNVAASWVVSSEIGDRGFPIGVVWRLFMLSGGLVGALAGVRAVGHDSVLSVTIASVLTGSVALHGALYARRASRTWHEPAVDAVVSEGS